ncbi:50S ribosomal protein L17 [Thermodesulfobacteriota bacterium]
MRHRKAGVKLNRTSSHRKAMFRNMVTSLFKHDRIRTTNVKAKELRSWADHLITLAKRGDLHARRQALAIVREKDVVHKLFEEVDKRYGDISGGYTRVVKLGRRPGDAAPISIVELVDAQMREKKKKSKKKEKADAVPTSIPEEKPDENLSEEGASEALGEATDLSTEPQPAAEESESEREEEAQETKTTEMTASSEDSDEFPDQVSSEDESKNPPEDKRPE